MILIFHDGISEILNILLVFSVIRLYPILIQVLKCNYLVENLKTNITIKLTYN